MIKAYAFLGAHVFCIVRGYFFINRISTLELTDVRK
jgi:hypothetical protein